MCCIHKLSNKHTLIRREKEGRKEGRKEGEEGGREGLVTTVSELPNHMASTSKTSSGPSH